MSSESEVIELRRRVTDLEGGATGKFNQCPMYSKVGNITGTLDKICKQNEQQLEILTAWDMMKSTARVFEWLGKFLWSIIKVCSAVGVIVGSVWAYLKYLARVI